MLVITIGVRPYVLREECNLVCHSDHVSRVSGGFSKRRKRRKEKLSGCRVHAEDEQRACGESQEKVWRLERTLIPRIEREMRDGFSEVFELLPRTLDGSELGQVQQNRNLRAQE